MPGTHLHRLFDALEDKQAVPTIPFTGGLVLLLPRNQRYTIQGGSKSHGALGTCPQLQLGTPICVTNLIATDFRDMSL